MSLAAPLPAVSPVIMRLDRQAMLTAHDQPTERIRSANMSVHQPASLLTRHSVSFQAGGKA